MGDPDESVVEDPEIAASATPAASAQPFRRLARIVRLSQLLWAL
jgi:hypothetical protein